MVVRGKTALRSDMACHVWIVIPSCQKSMFRGEKGGLEKKGSKMLRNLLRKRI